MTRTETPVPGIGCSCYEHPMPKAGESIAPMPGFDQPQHLPPHKKQTETGQYVLKRDQKHLSYGKTQHFRCFITIYRENIISLQAENNLQNQKCPKGYIYDYDSPSGEHPLLFEISCSKTNRRKIYNMYVHIYIISRFLLRTLNHLQDGKSSVCKRIRNVRLTIRNKRKMPTANTRTGKESYEK